MTPDEVASGIQAIRAQTDAGFGVNFHMYVPQASEIVDICISEQVRAVSYSRSPDAKTIERFKAAGILCIPTVGALKHAKKAVELGADALVVQGSEGGGHTGQVASHASKPLAPCRGGGFAMETPAALVWSDGKPARFSDAESPADETVSGSPQRREIVIRALMVCRNECCSTPS